jgi:hypothetical protein
MLKIINLILFLFVSLIYISTVGCTVRNNFNTPKLSNETNNIKRIILFVGDEMSRTDRFLNSGAGNTLLAVTSKYKKIINLSQPLRSYAAYVFEMSHSDTGSIQFLIGLEQPLGKQNFYSIKYINLGEYKMVNNFLHINTYMKRIDNSRSIPVIESKVVDVDQDIFLAARPMKFKHVLTYNLSTDSVVFESKKAIATKKQSNEMIYQHILKRNMPVDTSILK